MARNVIIFSILFFMFTGFAAFALEEQTFVPPDNANGEWQEFDTREAEQETIRTFIPDYVKTPEGGVSWEILAATKEVPFKGKDADGFDVEGVKPEFGPELLKLDKTSILIQGYMFPLGQEDAQSAFLFGPFPVSCPYHYHVGPSMVIEVHAKEPINFTYEPINVKGNLELIHGGGGFDLFYRLKDAVVVP